MIAAIERKGWWFPNSRGKDHFIVGRGSSICGTFRRDPVLFAGGDEAKNACKLCSAMLARVAKRRRTLAGKTTKADSTRKPDKKC